MLINTAYVLKTEHFLKLNVSSGERCPLTVEQKEKVRWACSERCVLLQLNVSSHWSALLRTQSAENPRIPSDGLIQPQERHLERETERERDAGEGENVTHCRWIFDRDSQQLEHPSNHRKAQSTLVTTHQWTGNIVVVGFAPKASLTFCSGNIKSNYVRYCVFCILNAKNEWMHYSIVSTENIWIP